MPVGLGARVQIGANLINSLEGFQHCTVNVSGNAGGEVVPVKRRVELVGGRGRDSTPRKRICVSADIIS